MSKLVIVKTRLSQREHAELEQLARDEDRSVASFLRLLIRERLSKQKGDQS